MTRRSSGRLGRVRISGPAEALDGLSDLGDSSPRLGHEALGVGPGSTRRGAPVRRADELVQVDPDPV